MIKKYVAQEIKMLSSKMNDQFGFLSLWKRKLKSIFTGKNEQQLMFDDLSLAKIEQVLLIEKRFGNLESELCQIKCYGRGNGFRHAYRN